MNRINFRPGSASSRASCSLLEAIGDWDRPIDKEMAYRKVMVCESSWSEQSDEEIEPAEVC